MKSEVRFSLRSPRPLFTASMICGVIDRRRNKPFLVHTLGCRFACEVVSNSIGTYVEIDCQALGLKIRKNQASAMYAALVELEQIAGDPLLVATAIVDAKRLAAPA